MKYLILIAALQLSGIAMSKSLVVGVTKKEISCFGKKDGQLEITILGGKAPYSIECNGKSVNTVIAELGAGNYELVVKDAKGESRTMHATLVAPAPLTMNYCTKTETIVDGLSGALDMKFSGGTPWEIDGNSTYFVRLDGQSNIADPSSIKSGIHHLEIEDASGCKLGVYVNLTLNVVYNGVPVQHNEAINSVYNGYGNAKLTIYKNSMFTLNQPTSSGSVQQ